MSFGFIALTMLNCVSEPGILITVTTEHLATPGHQDNLGSGKVVKKGEGCYFTTSLLGYKTIYHGPKNSINDIAVSAGIQKIAVVDHSSFTIFTWFIRNCTIVWGE